MNSENIQRQSAKNSKLSKVLTFALILFATVIAQSWNVAAAEVVILNGSVNTTAGQSTTHSGANNYGSGVNGVYNGAVGSNTPLTFSSGTFYVTSSSSTVNIKYGVSGRDTGYCYSSGSSSDSDYPRRCQMTVSIISGSQRTQLYRNTRILTSGETGALNIGSYVNKNVTLEITLNAGYYNGDGALIGVTQITGNNVTIGAHTTHTYNSGVVTKAATHTTTGVRTYTCTVCGATKTETIPVVAHTYTISHTNQKSVKIAFF